MKNVTLIKKKKKLVIMFLLVFLIIISLLLIFINKNYKEEPQLNIQPSENLPQQTKSTTDEKPFVLNTFSDGSVLMSDGSHLKEDPYILESKWENLKIKFMDKCNYDQKATNYCECVFGWIKLYGKNDIDLTTNLISRSENEKPNEVMSAIHLCKDVEN